MNKFLTLIIIAFSCQSNDIENKETREIENEDSVALTKEATEKEIDRFKEGDEKNIDSVTIKIIGQWRVDSIYQKSSFYNVARECRLFHDWGGYSEGYCEKPGDHYDLTTKLIYQFSNDTLGIYYEVKDKNGLPVISEKTIKSEYLILKISLSSLTIFNVKTEVTEFLSRYN